MVLYSYYIRTFGTALKTNSKHTASAGRIIPHICHRIRSNNDYVWSKNTASQHTHTHMSQNTRDTLYIPTYVPYVYHHSASFGHDYTVDCRSLHMRPSLVHRTSVGRFCCRRVAGHTIGNITSRLAWKRLCCTRTCCVRLHARSTYIIYTHRHARKHGINARTHSRQPKYLNIFIYYIRAERESWRGSGRETCRVSMELPVSRFIPIDTSLRDAFIPP